MLVAVLALPALALFGLWRFADGRTDVDPTRRCRPPRWPPPATGAAAAALTTPLLSFRRVPGLIARDLNVERLRAAGRRRSPPRSTPRPASSSPSTAFAVGQPQPRPAGDPGEQPEAARRRRRPRVLGPDHTFTTDVRAAAPPSGGVVAGDLYLVGGGDPLLTSRRLSRSTIDPHPVINPTSLDALADAVVAAGVTAVDGGVVGDGTRYDDEFFRAELGDDIRGIEAGPFDALLVNDARFRTRRRVAGRQRPERRRRRGAGPPARASAASSIAGDGEHRHRAEQRHVRRERSHSAPLPAVIAEMLATSDNNTAEMLVKEIGVRSRRRRQHATPAPRRWPRRCSSSGVDTTGVVVDDGSGLSNDNRADVPPARRRARPAHARPTRSAPGSRSPAQTGTLERRVHRLAGRRPADGQDRHARRTRRSTPTRRRSSRCPATCPSTAAARIEFAFVLNSPGTLTDQSVYRPIWDAFADVLAAYPSGPTAADLGPRSERLMGACVLPMFPLGTVAAARGGAAAARVRAALPPARPRLPRRRDRRRRVRRRR